MRDWSVVCGISAAEPTAFSDFTTVSTLTYYDCVSVNVREGSSGTAMTIDVNFGSWGPLNAGENVWVAFFRGFTPSGSDIPVAVAGPFVIDAA